MVEMLDLLPEDKVLEQRRAPDASLEAELVLYGAADVRCHEACAVVHLELVQQGV